MEPYGGNCYKPHQVRSPSGTVWRCKHGNTGFDSDMLFVGCADCAWEIGLTTWLKYHLLWMRRKIWPENP